MVAPLKNNTMASIIVRLQKDYFTFQQPLNWTNVFGITILHIVALYATISVLPFADPKTYLFGYTIGITGGLGVTVGAHRLWTHKTFKAKLPLRIFLMCTYMMAGQYSLESWVWDHRTHHKYTDTNADPHNAKRGFFFSHCGWLMMKRHPDVKEKGKLIDISDLKQDPVVRFHQKYYLPLLLFFHIIFPITVPLFWNESLFNIILGIMFFRYTLQLNMTWIVNSVAHFYGTKPYNKNILAVQNRYVSFFTLGEGWHNFHHVFPWDYRIGEVYNDFKGGARFIKFCEYLGLAYDLKRAPSSMIRKVIDKNGTLDMIEMPAPLDKDMSDKDISNKNNSNWESKENLKNRKILNSYTKFNDISSAA